MCVDIMGVSVSHGTVVLSSQLKDQCVTGHQSPHVMH